MKIITIFITDFINVKVKISSFLNLLLHELLVYAATITLIILFSDRNIEVACVELPQNIRPYSKMDWTLAK
jgi:hypothetical protein